MSKETNQSDAPAVPPLRAFMVSRRRVNRPDELVEAHSYDISRSGVLLFHTFVVAENGFRQWSRRAFANGTWDDLREELLAPPSPHVH